MSSSKVVATFENSLNAIHLKGSRRVKFRLSQRLTLFVKKLICPFSSGKETLWEVPEYLHQLSEAVVFCIPRPTLSCLARE
jgi:hypothetical protein